MKKFKLYKQPELMECGPSCLRMVAKYYEKNYRLQTLRELSGINREGVNLLGISEAAEKIGFRTAGVKVQLDWLSTLKLPVILNWDQNNFAVLYKFKMYHIADSGIGLVQ